jgi:type I restriction enzyme M protein
MFFPARQTGLTVCAHLPPWARDDLLKRDKLSLDLFWIKDDSLEDSASLPDPDELAQEIVDDLQDALDQFTAIAGALKQRT